MLLDYYCLVVMSVLFLDSLKVEHHILGIPWMIVQDQWTCLSPSEVLCTRNRNIVQVHAHKSFRILSHPQAIAIGIMSIQALGMIIISTTTVIMDMVDMIMTVITTPVILETVVTRIAIILETRIC
jgi:hypothetical protein